jgi:hypothetical protein
MFDRAFLAAELLCNLVKSGTERHFVVPAKSNTRWTVIEGNAQDAVVEMKVSPAARKKAPGLPTHWHVRAVCVKGPQGKPVYLLTSLFDRKRFKAAQLQHCYSRRWQIETSYLEIKQTMMGMAVSLRSMSVDATRQEIWGMLIAYNLIRLEMARTAEQANCKPNSISVVFALATFQFEMTHAAVLHAQGNLPGVLNNGNMQAVIAARYFVKNNPGQWHVYQVQRVADVAEEIQHAHIAEVSTDKHQETKDAQNFRPPIISVPTFCK